MHSHPAEDELVNDLLKEYGELTRQHLRRYLPAAESGTYLYDLMADYPHRGGKMLRPSLCIASVLLSEFSEALGAELMTPAAWVTWPRQ